MVEVPTSNRFYLITSDEQTRDPGAPSNIQAIDASSTPLLWEIKARFVFNAQPACQWFNQLGLRNAIETEDTYDMQFNVRGETTRWLQWLAENFAVEMDRVVGRVSQNYEWENLTFNFPVGANAVGVLPPDAAEEDLVPALDAAEEELTALFSDELDERIGTADGIPFFCGIGHNQASPEDCANIQIEIVDVRPSNRDLLTSRETIQNAQADLDNAQQLDAIAADQAELDSIARERDETRAIAEAQSQERTEAARLRAELGITDEEIDVLELEVLRAQNEASLAVAPCTQIGVTGIECVLLLAVLTGTDLPTVLGDLGAGGVQVQVPPGGGSAEGSEG